MKSIFFKILLICMCVGSGSTLFAQDTIRKNLWSIIRPHYLKLQFAGGMGIASFGTGWEYAKGNIETDILFGIVPGNAESDMLTTFTIKQNFRVWGIQIADKIDVSLIRCGFYMNFILNRSFWINNLDRYPTGYKYYGITPRVRPYIFLGQQVGMPIKSMKGKKHHLSLFYEVSICDLHLVTAFTNKVIRPKDYLGLSLGIKYNFW